LPSNNTPLGALPARFRRTRILVVGCGDVGMRLLNHGGRHIRWLALTSSPQRVAELRSAGALPLVGDLDQADTLARLAGVAQRVVHLAPPPSQGQSDDRTRHLALSLARRSVPWQWVYASTTGVYGDCHGQWVDETRAVQPQTDRAWRRVDAENSLRWIGHIQLGRTSVSILRIPGIYAPDRSRGTPRERLLRGSPILLAAQDVYTNHIHADDLARAMWLTIWRGSNQRAYNICDDSSMLMGDYFERAADLYGLPRPPRVSLSMAQTQLTPMQLSFMSESRRLHNQRMKRELRLRLHHPDVLRGLQGLRG
jgi:nucleoside-diphosphate-sugar epimerase